MFSGRPSTVEVIVYFVTLYIGRTSIFVWEFLCVIRSNPNGMKCTALFASSEYPYLVSNESWSSVFVLVAEPRRLVNVEVRLVVYAAPKVPVKRNGLYDDLTFLKQIVCLNLLFIVYHPKGISLSSLWSKVYPQASTVNHPNSRISG